jgi:conjugal transfer mating pair stabilization protein TraG
VDSSSFSSLESIADTATRLRATGTRLSEDASNVKSGSESVSGNEGTAFFNWMIQEKGLPVLDARRLWIGANAADLDHGMALAQEYNNQQAQSLAAKYAAAATPAKADIPLTPDLANAEKVTNSLRDRSDLRPAPVQPSTKRARTVRKQRSTVGGDEPKPQLGWQPEAPLLNASPQAAAFKQRNAAAASTTDTVNQGVEHGETTLENQQVREHVNITDQVVSTSKKVGSAAVKLIPKPKPKA